MKNQKKTEVIVLMSGGIDSTAAVHYYIQNQYNVRGLFVDYGQAPMNKEMECAVAIAKLYCINLDIVKIDFDESFLSGEIRGRNAFLIFTALMKYQSFKGLISIAIHTGTNYYDCSEAFLEIIKRFVSDYTNGNVQVDCPFIKWDKKLIVDYFIKSNLPLNMTYSCEQSALKACGQCQSCLERKLLIC